MLKNKSFLILSTIFFMFCLFNSISLALYDAGEVTAGHSTSNTWINGVTTQIITISSGEVTETYRYSVSGLSIFGTDEANTQIKRNTFSIPDATMASQRIGGQGYLANQLIASINNNLESTTGSDIKVDITYEITAQVRPYGNATAPWSPITLVTGQDIDFLQGTYLGANNFQKVVDMLAPGGIDLGIPTYVPVVNRYKIDAALTGTANPDEIESVAGTTSINTSITLNASASYSEMNYPVASPMS